MAEKKPGDFRSEWDALKSKAAVLQAHSTGDRPPGHPEVEAHEAAIAALNAEKNSVAHRAWLTTARDLEDLALLAEVVFDQFWDIATFPLFPADIDDRDDQQVSVAYLVRGIADVARAQPGSGEEGA